jgi:hypothetical protein
MSNEQDMLTLARNVLGRTRPNSWDSTWDSRGTPAKTVSQGPVATGTAKSATNQYNNPAVPLSHTIGDGTAGHPENGGTALGTVAGQSPYSVTLAALTLGCPASVESDRWRQAIRDADAFLAVWADRAQRLDWTPRDLFGLHPVPKDHPARVYSRLSRYDAMGLIWLLQGRPVVAMTMNEAAIRGTAAVTIYRRVRPPLPIIPIPGSKTAGAL